MREINLEVGTPSRVVVERGLLDQLTDGKLLSPAAAAFIVTDENVAPLYLQQVKAGLEAAGSQVSHHAFAPGEKLKSFDNLLLLYEQFHGSALERTSLVVALGGGTVGDLTGFAAATYMRGTRFVQIPTTLLAQVDAAIGGKVALNHFGLKNIIGSFYQPETVVIDPLVLSTLPQAELRCGLAEVIKAAIINDAQLLEILEVAEELPALPDDETLEEIIFRAASVKVEVVEKDERESGLRRVLNFGHTAAHALESLESFEGLTHGEAVAAGMVLEARLGVKLGLTDADLPGRLERLIAKLGFKPVPVAEPERILELMYSDKKTKARKLVFALPVAPGTMEIVEDVDPATVLDVLKGAQE